MTDSSHPRVEIRCFKGEIPSVKINGMELAHHVRGDGLLLESSTGSVPVLTLTLSFGSDADITVDGDDIEVVTR